jgi:hypothetical protein
VAQLLLDRSHLVAELLRKRDGRRHHKARHRLQKIRLQLRQLGRTLDHAARAHASLLERLC